MTREPVAMTPDLEALERTASMMMASRRMPRDVGDFVGRLLAALRESEQKRFRMKDGEQTNHLQVADLERQLAEAHRANEEAHRIRADLERQLAEARKALRSRPDIELDAPTGNEWRADRVGATYFPHECVHSAPPCPGCESWSQFDPLRGSMRHVK